MVVSRLDWRRPCIDEGGEARIVGAIPGAIIGVLDGKQAKIEGIAMRRKKKQHKLEECAHADHRQQQGCQHRPDEKPGPLPQAEAWQISTVGGMRRLA
jgi:hypothetical protein